MMLNVQAALSAAQVPGYRGAFRPLPGQREPPAQYCAYTLNRTPTWAADDADRAERVRAFLHLYSLNSPEDAQAAIEAAMKVEGFALVRANDDYDHDAGTYEVLSEWEGVKHVH